MNELLIKRRESYLDYLAQILTKEQHEKACSYLRKLSEYDLSQFLIELELKSKQYEPLSDKERLRIFRQIEDKHFQGKYDPAFLYQKTKLMSEEDKKPYFSIINNSHVKDYIHLTGKEDRFLIDLWEGKQNWNINVENGETRGIIHIPSDLFFAKTIPLTDCVIEIDESKDLPNGKIAKARVICFPNYIELIDKANTEQSENMFEVGLIVIYQNEIPICFSVFGICRGIDSLIHKMPFGLFPQVTLTNPNQTYQLNSLVVSFLETWYGLQIALLHPDVKEVFKNPHRVSEETTNKKDYKKKKRFVRYVRKHFITLQDLEEHAHTKEAESKYKRKCLVWYVIGHWRTYKNGTKTFIQPHWKGVLRNIKKETDVEPRKRSLVYEDGTCIG